MSPVDGPLARRWAEKAQELEFTELDRVRSAAEKWGASITALTGVFGLTALLKGPDDVTVLTTFGKWVVGVALLVALAAAACAVGLAAVAAQGVPRADYNTGRKLEKYYHDEAETAASRLTCSRWLSLAVLVALASAIGYTWFGPRAPAPAGHAMAVQQSGLVVCGELNAGDDGRLQLKASNGDVTRLDQIESINLVEGCP